MQSMYSTALGGCEFEAIDVEIFVIKLTKNRSKIKMNCDVIFGYGAL